MAAEKGTSVLASLTASVMAEKKTEARKLTPVEGEFKAPALPNDVGIFFSNEQLLDHAKDLRRFAADAIAIADGLDQMVGGSSENPGHKTIADIEREKQRDKEREADERVAEKVEAEDPSVADFATKFAEKQKQAQEAVFAQQAEQVDLGWKCPEHGKATVKTSAKTQRQYVGCPDCNQFQR